MTRITLLNELIERYGYRRYLEIGCDNDQTFSKVQAERKTGVDPVRGGTIRFTSDQFFSEYTGPPFDLVFIDGFHERNQALRDIHNSLLNLSRGGCIVVHDCLPTKREHQLSPEEFRSHFNEEPPAGKTWNGDVWKAFVSFRTFKAWDSAVLNADYGLGIVLPRRNTEPLEISALPLVLDWQAYKMQRDVLLRVMNWTQLDEWLPGNPHD